MTFNSSKFLSLIVSDDHMSTMTDPWTDFTIKPDIEGEIYPSI